MDINESKKKSEKYNFDQAELVRKCDERYRKGMKERTSSGSSTEDLLITFLQMEFEGRLFFKNIMVSKIDSEEEYRIASKKKRKELLSPQTDIVSFTNKKDIWEHQDGQKAIAFKNVKSVIEVKKKDTIESDQIHRLTSFYDSIPIFFVSFRGTGSKRPVSETRFAKKILDTTSDRSNVDVFMFSWQNTKDSERIRKSISEGVSEIVRIEGFEGELERLVRRIKKTIN